MSARRTVDQADIVRLGHLHAMAIARKLGFAHSSISRAAKRYGVTLPPPPRPKPATGTIGVGASAFWQQHFAQALSWRNNGVSTREIARRLNTTRGAVIGAFYRAGICEAEPSPPRRHIEFPPAGHCVFPLGDPPDADFAFCGAVAREGGSYCSHHHAVCYKPASELEMEA